MKKLLRQAGTWMLAIVMISGLTLMLMALAGVFRAKVPGEAKSIAPIKVGDLPVAEVRLLKQPVYESASGTIQPVHESAVASKLLARVTEVTVTAGESVTKDQILIQLDDADLQARLRQMQAALESAKTQRDRAVADFQRAEQLKEKKAIAASDFDALKSAAETMASSVTQAEEAVREAEVILERATVRAPMDGTVIDKRVDVGDTVSPGQILLTLFDPTHMQMVASVRETLALHLKPGQLLPARVDALNIDCEARISELVPEADVASRSFTVKVTGPCMPGAYSGMFGRLFLPVAEDELLLIPSEAVSRVGQLTMCHVVENDTLHRRYIRTGRIIDSDVEVLSGLSAGERVVVGRIE
ncbi:MAG: efflux RND transporter periplasmic adaptor subunit [Planctomycetaceae bacterium]|nr:efflux RND transporter periplasmic adaptor subunit [Planctomycetaceae bacterium]